MKTRPSLASLRKQMYLPTDGTILLNAGTMSPTPKPVFDAAVAIRQEQASNPHRFFFERQGQYIAIARGALARHLRVELCDLFLIPNVTIALNLAIHAIDRAVRDRALVPTSSAKRDTVLISSLEYGSISLAWKQATSLKLEFVPIHQCRSWDEIVDAFRKRITHRTAALCVSHVAQPTGRVLPVKALINLARTNGVLSVIDGAHAPGLLPLDIPSLGADAYGANMHKWMMGLANSGFLHVSPRFRELLKPMFVSWGSKDLRAENREHIAPFFGGTQLQGAIEFWGCVDRVPQMVLPQTLAFVKRLGESRMRSRMADLGARTREKVGSVLEPVTFDDPESAGALTAFRLPDCDRIHVRNWFWRRKIAVGVTRLREDIEDADMTSVAYADREAYLRISTAWFTKESEIDALAAACRAWIKRQMTA